MKKKILTSVIVAGLLTGEALLFSPVFGAEKLTRKQKKEDKSHILQFLLGILFGIIVIAIVISI